MPEHFIAWWNVENLFDIANSPRRSDKLLRTLAGELRGWTAPVLTRKIAQLAHVISAMNAGRGPDLLGVCEVENAHVLDRLVTALAPLGRDYRVAHHDSTDGRGIDVAFIHDAAHFTAGERFDHVIQKRTATRELVQVNFRTAAGRPLIVVGNHWPSRLGGQFESEPYRIVAAETLAYFHGRILEELGKETPILVMGDFNDLPADRSLVHHAESVIDRGKVTRARTNPRLLNLTWPLLGTGIGTHYYDGEPGWLDQFLANKPLLRTTDPIQVVPDSMQIFRLPEMRTSSQNAAPKRHGRPAKKEEFDRDGFSDHYPITLRLRER